MKLKIHHFFTVDQSPQEVSNAINNVRGGGRKKLRVRLTKLGAEFKFHYKGLSLQHSEDHGIGTGQAKAYGMYRKPNLTLSKTRPSGNGTDVVFEITKRATKPNSALRTSACSCIECYGDCTGDGACISTAVCGILITTGKWPGPAEKKRDAKNGSKRDLKCWSNSIRRSQDMCKTLCGAIPLGGHGRREIGWRPLRGCGGTGTKMTVITVRTRWQDGRAAYSGRFDDLGISLAPYH